MKMKSIDCTSWMVNSFPFREKTSAEDIAKAIEEPIDKVKEALSHLAWAGVTFWNTIEDVDMSLDDYVMPITMLVIGYPTQQQKDRKKPDRFERQYLVHENHYRKLMPDEHREMFEKRAADEKFDYDEFMDKFCSRKYMSSFSIEMTRSSEVYLEQFLEKIAEKQED